MGNPVHTWHDLDQVEGGGWQNKYATVAQIMSKELITIQDDDLLDLAKNMMIWSNIHHLPVENSQGKLVGLITSDRILDFLGKSKRNDFSFSVGDAMLTQVITTTPDVSSMKAYQIMRDNEIGCLPVMDKGVLVGIVTLNDFLKLLSVLLDEIAVTPSEGS